MTDGLTPEKAWQGPFLQRLADTGNVTAACKKAKISRARVYEVRGDDLVFAHAWDEALEIAIENLEMEARRRAEKGVPEYAIVNNKKVLINRKYSDTLLIFLLKAHKPDKYRDNVKHEYGGKIDIGIVKGYATVNPDDWDEDTADSNV